MKKILLFVIFFKCVFSVGYSQCTKPNVVEITTPSLTTLTICHGTAQTLSGTVTVTAGSQNNNFTYSWIKAGSTSASNVVLQTATIPILINTPTVIPNYTGITGMLSDAGKYILRIEDGNSSNASCFRDDTLTLVVNALTTPGSISAAQTICSGDSPVSFTQTTAATGGNGVMYYGWEKSVNAGVYTDIASATNSTYDEGILTNSGTTPMTVHYRRKVFADVCPQVASAPIRITVNPAVVAGVIAANQTICSGGDPAAFTQTTAATGGIGVYTYQWQSSYAIPGPWTNIAGSTSATYDPPAGITATTLYRRIDASGTCFPSYTNPIIITVAATVLPSVIIATPSATICAGTSITLTATPVNGGTPTYIWQKNGVAIAPAATNSTYTTSGAQNGDVYYVHMSSSASCAGPATVTSNAIVVTVTTVLTPAVSIISSPGNTICPGTSVTFTSNPSNGGTAPVYEWFVNNVSQGAASASKSTFTNSTLLNGDQVSAVMTSNSGCLLAPGSVTSNAIVMTVSTILAPVVTLTASPTTICSNGATTFTASPSNGGTAPVYEWFVNNVSQGAASSSAILSTSALTSSSDVVKVILSSNAGCSSPSTASATNSIIVNQGIGSGTIGSDQTICYNTIPAAITQITAPTNIAGTPTYSWEASVSGAPGTFIVMPGSSGVTYTPMITITQDVYIRRVTTDPGTLAPCNVAISNVIHIIVLPQLTPGTISSNETICSGTAATTITETSSPAGGLGVFIYQWESRIQSGGPYATILNAANATYNPGVLNLTTFYRRIENAGSCGITYSNEISKDVVSNILPTITIEDPGQTCDGDIALFKSQATNMGLTPTYNWYKNNNLIVSISPTSASYNIFEPLKSGDEIWVELISSNLCANTSSVLSNKVILNLVPCTVSNSIYTINNIPILLQQYVSNSIPNVIDYTYFWSITGGTITTPIITGPNTITLGQQNTVYNVPHQTGLAYTWSITGGTIVSGQNTHSVTVDWDDVVSSSTTRTTSASYSISVTLTNQTNDTNTSTLDIHTLTTSTTLSQAQSGINVFPNPTTGTFNIEMPESGVAVAYEILDLTGLTVASGIFTSTGSDQTIDSDLDAGMYQIVLKYNNTVTCVRLSKVL